MGSQGTGGSGSSETEKAKTESIFREVNERVSEVGARGEPLAVFQHGICECGNAGCAETISITAAEYERLRSHSTWFAITPSDAHFFPEVERIVEKNERFWVVEKLDHAADVARKLDPRSRKIDGPAR